MLDQISVIIAAKNPPAEQFILCLTSFAALANASKLQVIIITSGSLPKLPNGLTNNFSEFKIVETPPEGVYAAYNTGCDHAEGAYTLFFGADDIALPGMDALIDQVLLKDHSYHMVAAASYMQATGISRPTRWRLGLVFANWCHQGLFYNTSYLKNHRYERAYKIQADHKMNIDIISNPSHKVLVSDQLVAYFSAGGVSSTVPDLKFRKDFPEIVSGAYGRHWGFFVRLKQIAIDLVKGPPDKRFQSTHRR